MLAFARQRSPNIAPPIAVTRTLLALAAVALLVALPARAQAPTAKGRTGLALDPIVSKWTGDVAGMIERRLVRILTV